MSGISLDDVRVKYNSAEPAKLQAHAYAQGNTIHVAPGQHRHLPHELWHVVQQRQGRVRSTTRVEGFHVNDNPVLEREADVMGARAWQSGDAELTGQREPGAAEPASSPHSSGGAQAVVAQFAFKNRGRKDQKLLKKPKRKNRAPHAKDERNLADHGDGPVTVYRVEADAKPNILHITQDADAARSAIRGRIRAPTGNVSFQELTTSNNQNKKHYLSFGTEKRAIDNFHQRVATAKALVPGGRVAPKDRLKLKSFQVRSEIVRQIQKQSVPQSQAGSYPDRPENSDQNHAPDQFALQKPHFRRLIDYVIPGSAKEYSKAEIAILTARHKRAELPADEVPAESSPHGKRGVEKQVRRPRGSGKRNISIRIDGRARTYDAANDPHEHDE